MKIIKLVAAVGIGIVGYSLVFPRSAYAYLDPGTGSYIFQILIATFIGGAFAVKLFWGKIVKFSKRLLGRITSDERDKK